MEDVSALANAIKYWRRMPSFRCRNPVCDQYLKEPGACAECSAKGHSSSRHTFYDQHLRDPAAKRFYDSRLWQQTRARKLTETPWCERCGKPADTVHHVTPLKQCDERLKTLKTNLTSLCKPCHNALEAENGK